jgi:hypothetical protein
VQSRYDPALQVLSFLLGDRLVCLDQLVEQFTECHRFQPGSARACLNLRDAQQGAERLRDCFGILDCTIQRVVQSLDTVFAATRQLQALAEPG